MTRLTRCVKHWTTYSCLLLATSLPGVTGAAELTITVAPLKDMAGTLYIRVYSPASQWLSEREDGPVASAVVDLKAETFTTGEPQVIRTFVLPEGIYAATAIQDINNNSRLDRDWRGVPQEPSGTSGKFTAGLPTFEDSKFRLGSEGSSERIVFSE
jgi:uncharacterized protein (DUF2141 family)